MDADRYTVAGIQHVYRGSYEATVEHVEHEIRRAAGWGAKMICLQELFAYPYFCRNADPGCFEYAQIVPGPLTGRLSRLAAELAIVLIVPLFEKRMEGLFHNSAVVIQPDGRIEGIYRKIHIPDDPGFHEKYYFTPGDLGFRVFETPFARIAVLICWDQWFPEAARIAALEGAEIIFFPTAIGILEGEESLESRYLEAWRIIQRAAAVANGVFVTSVNRVGREGTVRFWGGSFICGPFGEILAQIDDPAEENICLAEIAKGRISETRRTWPFFRDRAVRQYRSIIELGPRE